jgi:uncharacterized cupin superfamily protein
MATPVTANIFESPWEMKETPRGGIWKYLDISGEHLGLRLEELAPGATSSIHHFHTLEEEHVIVLEGEASLVLGGEEHRVTRGDHVWFKAGEEVGHHIVNRSDRPFKFLVIGERKEGDVVFYPEAGVATVKALGWKQYDVKQRSKPKRG